jgi:hypothetical protein
MVLLSREYYGNGANDVASIKFLGSPQGYDMRKIQMRLRQTEKRLLAINAEASNKFKIHMAEKSVTRTSADNKISARSLPSVYDSLIL